MVTAIDNGAYDRVVDPIFRVLPNDQLRQLLSAGPDPKLESRVEELAGKCSQGELTAEERAEYEGYVQANRFVSLVKAQAKKILAGQ
jgi:hypothetical protein